MHWKFVFFKFLDMYLEFYSPSPAQKFSCLIPGLMVMQQSGYSKQKHFVEPLKQHKFTTARLWACLVHIWGLWTCFCEPSDTQENGCGGCIQPKVRILWTWLGYEVQTRVTSRKGSIRYLIINQNNSNSSLLLHGGSTFYPKLKILKVEKKFFNFLKFEK